MHKPITETLQCCGQTTHCTIVCWKCRSVYACVCKCVCVCVCMYVCMCVCMYVRMYAYMHVSMYVCTYVCMYVKKTVVYICICDRVKAITYTESDVAHQISGLYSPIRISHNAGTYKHPPPPKHPSPPKHPLRLQLQCTQIQYVCTYACLCTEGHLRCHFHFHCPGAQGSR